MQHDYDAQFMGYTSESSRHSALTISKLVKEVLPIKNVLDVGCARGAWLAAWQRNGVEEICGVDGGYVDTNSLYISRECFIARDLAKQFDLKHKFDLVQSLEVAEHIPTASADIFVKNLVRHSSGMILFSAAPPGQGGEFHVNEQPYEYWRKKFRAHGFKPYDYIRPLIAADKSISFWYRYNIVLYLQDEAGEGMPEMLRVTQVPDTQVLSDRSPHWFRMRKAMVRALPISLRDWLARAKAHHYRSK